MAICSVVPGAGITHCGEDRRQDSNGVRLAFAFSCAASWLKRSSCSLANCSSFLFLICSANSEMYFIGLLPHSKCLVFFPAHTSVAGRRLRRSIFRFG